MVSDIRQPVRNHLNRRWGWAWVLLTLALAVHVLDEAVTDFLPFYNSLVTTLRRSYAWVPLPTFEFSVWLGGLIIAVVSLLALAPLVFAGRPAMRTVSYLFAIVMVVNALGHAGASVYLSEFAPGVYSSPLLFGAAVYLLHWTRRSARERPALS